jgi:hypothetical protein
MNVTEVFDGILTLDEQAAAASVPVSETHKTNLRRILNDIVSHVMNPVQFYMDTHKPSNDQTAGAYTPDNNSIWIQRQQVGQPVAGILGQGIRMSAAEVYAHELIHHITYFGLKQNAELARQAYDLYEFARESFKAQYGNNAFKVFMNDPNDMSNPYEIQAAKARWEYLFNPVQRPDMTHSGVDEFLAFGMTNENFKRELTNLAISQELLNKRKTLLTVFEKNIQTTVVNIYRMVLDFIQNLFHQQTHSSMVAQEIENLVVALAKTDAKNKNVLFSAAVEGEAKLTEFGLNMDRKVQNVANEVMNKFQLGRAITELKKLPQMQNMIGHQIRVGLLWYKDQQQGFIPTLFNEMKGANTDNLKKLYALQSKNNLLIDIAKQEAFKIMAAVNRDWFNKKLDPHEKTAITKVLLRGDISFLEGISSFAAIKGFIESPTQREARLRFLQGEIQTLVNSTIKNVTQRQQIMTFFEGGVKDLAYSMATGERFVEGINYINAHNLALMDNTKYAGRLATSPVFNEIVNKLDQMASISSLNYMSTRDKHTVVALMNSNPEAINNVLINHKLLQQQAKRELFNDNPALMEKGYVKTILNPRIQFEQGTLADEQSFADRGFTKAAYPFKRDGQVDPVKDDIYMYISHNGSINDFLSGVFSTTRNKQKGVNEFDIQIQLGNQTNPALVANANNQAALTAIKRKADAMLTSSARTIAPMGYNAMTPSFNTEGKMVKLRYIMSEHVKDTVLQQFSEFDTVLGSMANQIVDKTNTPIINADAVVALREMWDSEKNDYPEAYVKISPTSPIKRYRDIYENLPVATKQQILSEWGKNEMMVSQEVIDLVFGQRKYSVTEMFEKNDLERNLFERLAVEAMTFVLGFNNPLVKKELDSPKGRAVTRTKTIEDFLIQATKLAKGNIIVRNIRVTWGNHVSNVMYLKSKGVPIKSIVRWQREAFTSALQYQADNDKLRALMVKRDVLIANTNISQATKDTEGDVLNRQIMRLQHILANNPSTKMIEAGLLPSIVDDVNTEISPSPHKFGLEKAIDTGLSKLPNKVEKVGRVLFMTEDTEGFKTLNNMVKMTDYVGRYVLYKHYTEKGMVHKEAVERVTDEFINFAPPTHRMLEYANNIGLVWFSKYQLRVLRHIKNIITEHPFSALATLIIGSTIHNNNILNTIPFATKDMGRMIGDPLSALFSSSGDIFTIDALDTITPDFK